MNSFYQIAAIIPTIYRPELLAEVVASLKDFPYILPVVIDQNTNEIGLSAARNLGVEQAKAMEIPYCLIMADSILATPTFGDLPILLQYFDKYDLIGLNLIGRIGWEGTLSLLAGQSFELDFLNKDKECDDYIIETQYSELDDSPCHINIGGIWKCNIVRNFFLAKTQTLFDVKWDNNLKMREHEDFFYRYAQAGYKVGCTDLINGDYIGEESKSGNSDYALLRRKNMDLGLKYLLQKYNIKKWITYKNKKG